MEENKKEQLTEKQILKRKKLLLKLEQNLKELENEVNEAKKRNVKNKIIRRTKISLRTAQLVAPYLLTASITFRFFSSIGFTPFVIDNNKKFLETKKDFDSLGNIKYENQYTAFENPYSTISYVGKWSKYDDTFYSREVKTYNIKKIDEETIHKIVNDNNIDELESIFNSPKSTVQISNNITEKDLETEPYIEATLYSTKTNEFISIKETVGKNIFTTFIWVLLTFLFELMTLVIRENIDKFNYGNCIYAIKQEYPIADINELTKKLEIAKNNYNRLTR